MRWLALTIALAACGNAPAKDPPTKNNKPETEASLPTDTIGTATMDADGVITMMLRAEDGKGTVGDAMVQYRPGDKNYADIVNHLGGLKPGQTKPVPPFP
jgi:hypothetical protein